jgi:catechol-2,3-dioxygenase
MAQKAKPLGIAPQLVVKDVVQTAEYYRDVLGFSVLGYFWEPSSHGYPRWY